MEIDFVYGERRTVLSNKMLSPRRSVRTAVRQIKFGFERIQNRLT